MISVPKSQEELVMFLLEYRGTTHDSAAFELETDPIWHIVEERGGTDSPKTKLLQEFTDRYPEKISFRKIEFDVFATFEVFLCGIHVFDIFDDEYLFDEITNKEGVPCFYS